MTTETLTLVCACFVGSLMMVVQQGQLVLAGPQDVQVPKDFKDLLALANKLESTEMLPMNRPESLNKLHRDLVYAFNRESKRVILQRYYQQAMEKMDEFRLKSLQHVDEVQRGNKNWFGGVFGTVGAMRNIAKFDPFLEDLFKRYDQDEKRGQFTAANVECDMIKFRVKVLHSIMFVLDTEIKYLVTGEQQVLNQAVYDQLKADKMTSKVNYYELHRINNEQRQLLLKYFSEHADIETSKVADVVDHTYHPGQYITGRLLDSCQTILKFEEEWKAHDRLSSEQSVCKQAIGSGASDLSLFMKLHSTDKHNDVFTFCRAFFDAL